jgi:hypothetical protein
LGNVISGNTGNGILIQTDSTDATGSLITSNWIGTTASGSAAAGNQQAASRSERWAILCPAWVPETSCRNFGPGSV